MRKILFVCHGNICRSPMAEYVMKHLVSAEGREADFYIESAATSREEIGNDVYPPAQRKLRQMNIACPTRAARQITREDYQRFDEIYLMDSNNMRNIRRVLGESLYDADQSLASPKIRMLLDHDVADPWYTGNFDATYRDVWQGCMALLDQ